MGLTVYDAEVESTVPAAKMYESFVLQGDTLIPQVAPQAIKSIEILEGDGGAGTIKLLTLSQGSKFVTLKQRVDEVDKEDLTYGYTIIEGDMLVDPLESISYHVKVEPTEKGCILKSKTTYTCKGDHKIAEEQIKGGKDMATGLFKAVEAHLLTSVH